MYDNLEEEEGERRRTPSTTVEEMSMSMRGKASPFLVRWAPLFPHTLSSVVRRNDVCVSQCGEGADIHTALCAHTNIPHAPMSLYPLSLPYLPGPFCHSGRTVASDSLLSLPHFYFGAGSGRGQWRGVTS